MNRLVLSVLAALSLATPVVADSSLLVINNADRSVHQTLTGGVELFAFVKAYREQGISPYIAARQDAFGVRQAFLNFATNLDKDTDDVAIILTGRFVSTPVGSYLLPTNSKGNMSLAQVVTLGFPVDSVYAIAAEYPGRALVVLGVSDGNANNPMLLEGIPQGVTVAFGPADAAAKFTSGLLKRDEADILGEVRRSRLKLAGYVPRDLPVLSGRHNAVPTVVEQDYAAFEAEAKAAWQTALRADTEAAYQLYLSTYPNGANAGEARQRLNAIKAEPFYREKKIESELNLSRNMRREIQRDLSLLGYNTRGIDGIFGRGTRGAVKGWQDANGFTASGYLNRRQINRLEEQAERRAAELEEEARQRQAELERQDRAYWARSGAAGDEAGFRAYLKRYPDGVFAEVAQDKLGEIEERRRAEAGNTDRAIWAKAREADTIDAYRSYLRARPNGAFAQEAKARIDWLDANADLVAARRRGQADEAALGLNVAGRKIVESRLQSIGLKPGAVDGKFDEATRRAIRRYQDARNLRVSGYMDQATMVRLMADAILQ